MRTYLPRLLFLAQLICKYIRKYETTIRSNIPDDQETVLDGFLVACELLEDVLLALVPDPQ